MERWSNLATLAIALKNSTQRRKGAKTQRRKRRFATLQCYLRKLCILRKVFHALFSLFAPVHVVWLRLAALRLGAFALNPQSAIRNPQWPGGTPVPSRRHRTIHVLP
jgi:hypothetical protein